MSHVPQVVVVGCHSLVRRGLESLLSTCSETEVLAVFAAPHQWALAPDVRPDVIVTGRVSDHRHESVAGTVATLARHGRVLVLDDLVGRDGVTAVLRAGAHGCLPGRAADDEVLGAVATVAGGGIHISPVLATLLHTELRARDGTAPPLLARRELETLRWIAAGLTHGQIARRMSLTEATVNTYVKRIRSKLAVGNKADLTRKAIELGLLQREPDTLGTRPNPGDLRLPAVNGNGHPPLRVPTAE